MNYIAEAFKSLEDVDDSIVVSQPKQDIKESVKKVNNKKSIKESCKPIKEDKDLFEPDKKYSVYEDPKHCVDMIHSIIAYSRDFKDGEDLVQEQEHKYRNYLDNYIDAMGRDKVVELADIQVKRPHKIEKAVYTDSEGLSYNSLTFLDGHEDLWLGESCEKKAVKSKKSLKEGYAPGFYCYEEEEDYECEDEGELEDYVMGFEPYNPTIEYWYDEDEGVGHITWESSSYTDITDEKENSIDTDITVKELLDMWWNSVRIKGGKIKGTAILYKDCKDGSYELDKDNNPYGEAILDMVVHTKDEWDDDGDGYPIIYATIEGDKKESHKSVKEEASCKFVVVANKNDDRKEFDSKQDAIAYAKAHIKDEPKVFDCDKKEIWNYQTPEYKNIKEGKKAVKEELEIDYDKNGLPKEIYVDYEDLGLYEEDYLIYNEDVDFGEDVRNRYDEKELLESIKEYLDENYKDIKVVSFDYSLEINCYNPRVCICDIVWEDKKSKKESKESKKSKKKLKESESINLMDDEDIKKGQEILNSEKKEETEQIVDVDADTIDKLKDSYIGNVILQCPICRTLIYKKPDLLKKDEETDIYNKDEECPHCGSVDGFDLVGQVASLDVEAEDKTIETTGTDVEVKKDIEVEKEPAKTEEEDEEKEELKDKYDLPDLPDVEGKEEEIKFESLDNRKFDRLVNRYAHNVYENFKGFKSTNGKVDNEKNIIIIEGLISFKDGKNVKTRFVFNKLTESRRGDLVKFRGINETFSKGKNAFTLSAKVENKEIVCESLKYNYKAKLNEEFVLVKGKVDNKAKRK